MSQNNLQKIIYKVVWNISIECYIFVTCIVLTVMFASDVRTSLFRSSSKTRSLARERQRGSETTTLTCAWSAVSTSPLGAGATTVEPVARSTSCHPIVRCGYFAHLHPACKNVRMMLCWWWQLHVLYLQWSPPPPSSLAPVKCRMETFWYRFIRVVLENGC